MAAGPPFCVAASLWERTPPPLWLGSHSLPVALAQPGAHSMSVCGPPGGSPDGEEGAV